MTKVCDGRSVSSNIPEILGFIRRVFNLFVAVQSLFLVVRSNCTMSSSSPSLT